MVLSMTMAASIFGCGKKDEQRVSADNYKIEIVTSDTSDTPAEELSEEELQEIQEKLNTREYYGFLDQGFDRPENINWEEVFYDGADISTIDVSDKEKEALKKALQWDRLYGDCSAIAGKDMENFIKTHTGLDMNVKDVKTDGTYVEEYDKIYFLHFDANYVPYKCVGGTKSGDDYQVVIEVNEDIIAEKDFDKRQRTLSFTDKEGVYEIHSNLIDWQEDSDSEQSFEMDLGSGNNAMLYTYQGSDIKVAKVAIVKNGEALEKITLEETYSDNDNWRMSEVKAIGFVDYDLDGMNDMVVIGDTDKGQKVVVFHQLKDRVYGMYMKEDEISAYVEKNISAFTIADVKKCLMGEYESSAKDWKAAYSQLIRICDIKDTASGYNDYGYDLVDIDGDSLLELVTDCKGYGMSLYSYRDGKNVCWMDDWGYGAGGNHGYYFVPGKNRFNNFNADYAGAIGNDYYMSVKDDSVQTDYWAIYYNFNDKNGNFEPDDGEEDEELYEGKVTYHSEDRTLTDEKIEKKINEFASYSYEELTGSKTKAEILELLK